MCCGVLAFSSWHVSTDRRQRSFVTSISAGGIEQANGGRFLVRGMAAKVYEAGVQQRVVVIEFDTLALALAAHDTPAYQAALKELDGGAVERDLRIVEGIA